MSTKIPAQLEERLAYLESEVAKLKTKADSDTLSVPWWEKITGTFAENPAYDEAMELGREYRESLRPKTIEKSE